MAKNDVVIHKSKGLKVTLQTWRGQGIKVFEFESDGVMLRVRFEDGKFSVIGNEGKIEIPNSASDPFCFVLSK